MPRVVLVHWDSDEGKARAAELRAAGFTVGFERTTPITLRHLIGSPTDAFVIDLSRMPSQGRDVALSLRERKATRGVPIVFVAGAKEKVARLKQALPDAVYTSWGRIGTAITRAIAKPPKDPIAPGTFAGYSGTPLPQKLGIKPGSSLGLVGAPDDFERTLGKMPPDVAISRGPKKPADLIVWFATSRKTIEGNLARVAALIGDGGGLWVAWPKQASGVPTDVTQQYVRETLLANGLVDYKICAIDATWSGLKFARRRR
jgi:hypothetical protein